MIGRLWGWYLGLLGVAAGGVVGVLVVLEAWRGDLDGDAGAAQFSLGLILAAIAVPLGVALLSLVVPGFAFAALGAAPGFLVAAVVMLVRGEPDGAAWYAVCGLGFAAGYFLIPVVEAVLGTLFVAIAWGVVALFRVPFSVLGKVGAKTALVDCPQCGVERQAIKRTRVVLHALFTIATTGLWAPFWYLLAKRQRYRCVECNSPVEPGHMSASAISSTFPAGSSK